MTTWSFVSLFACVLLLSASTSVVAQSAGGTGVLNGTGGLDLALWLNWNASTQGACVDNTDCAAVHTGCELEGLGFVLSGGCYPYESRENGVLSLGVDIVRSGPSAVVRFYSSPGCAGSLVQEATRALGECYNVEGDDPGRFVPLIGVCSETRSDDFPQRVAVLDYYTTSNCSDTPLHQLVLPTDVCTYDHHDEAGVAPTGEAFSCSENGHLKVVKWSSTACMGAASEVGEIEPDSCFRTGEGYAKARCDVLYCQPLGSVNVDWNLDGDDTNDARDLSNYEASGGCPFSDDNAQSPCNAAVCEDGNSNACRTYVQNYCFGEARDGVDAAGSDDDGCDSDDCCPFTVDSPANLCLHEDGRKCDSKNRTTFDYEACVTLVDTYCDGDGASDPYCEFAYDAGCGCPYDKESSTSPCQNAACNGSDPMGCANFTMNYCRDDGLFDAACAGCPLAEISEVCIDDEVCSDGFTTSCWEAIERSCVAYPGGFCDWLYNGTNTPDCDALEAPACRDEGCPYTVDVPSNPCRSEACRNDSSECIEDVLSYCTGDGISDSHCDEVIGDCPWRILSTANPCFSDACRDNGGGTECQDVIQSYCDSAEGQRDPGCSDNEQCCPYSVDTVSNPCRFAGCDRSNDRETYDHAACEERTTVYCEGPGSSDAYCNFVFTTGCGCPYSRENDASPCAASECAGGNPSGCAGYIFDYCGDAGILDDACFGCPLARVSAACSGGACDDGNFTTSCWEAVESSCASYPGGFCDWLYNGTDDSSCVPQESPSECDRDGGCEYSIDVPSNPCRSAACRSNNDPGCLDDVGAYCNGEGSNDPKCDDILGECPYRRLVSGNPCFSTACRENGNATECTALVASYCSKYPTETQCGGGGTGGSGVRDGGGDVDVAFWLNWDAATGDSCKDNGNCELRNAGCELEGVGFVQHGACHAFTPDASHSLSVTLDSTSATVHLYSSQDCTGAIVTEQAHSYDECYNVDVNDPGKFVPLLGVCSTTQSEEFSQAMAIIDYYNTSDCSDMPLRHHMVPTGVCTYDDPDEDSFRPSGQTFSCASGGLKVVEWRTTACTREPVSVAEFQSDSCVRTDNGYVKARCDEIYCRPLGSVGVDWNLDGDDTNDERDISNLHSGDACRFSHDNPHSPCRAPECDDGNNNECRTYVQDYCFGEARNGVDAAGSDDDECDSGDCCPFTVDSPANLCLHEDGRKCDSKNRTTFDYEACVTLVDTYCDGDGASDPYCEFAYDAGCGCPYDKESSTSPCQNAACNGSDPMGCANFTMNYCRDDGLFDAACAGCPLAEVSEVCIDDEVCSDGFTTSCWEAIERSCVAYPGGFCDWLYNGTETPDCDALEAPACRDEGCPYTVDVPSNPCRSEACRNDSSGCIDDVLSYCTGDGISDSHCDEVIGDCPWRILSTANPCFSDACRDNGGGTECQDVIQSYCDSAEGQRDPGCSDNEQCCPYSVDTVSNPCRFAGCDRSNDRETYDHAACEERTTVYCEGPGSSDAYCNFVFTTGCGCPYSRENDASPCAASECAGGNPSGCAGYIFDYCGDAGILDDACFGCPLARVSAACSGGACDDGNFTTSCWEAVESSCASYPGGFCDWLYNGTDDSSCVPQESPSECDRDGGCEYSMDVPSNPCRSAACRSNSPECIDDVGAYCNGEGSNDPKCDDILGECPYRRLVSGNPCFSDACRDGGSSECQSVVQSYCSKYPTDPGCERGGTGGPGIRDGSGDVDLAFWLNWNSTAPGGCLDNTHCEVHNADCVLEGPGFVNDGMCFAVRGVTVGVELNENGANVSFYSTQDCSGQPLSEDFRAFDECYNVQDNDPGKFVPLLGVCSTTQTEEFSEPMAMLEYFDNPDCIGDGLLRPLPTGVCTYDDPDEDSSSSVGKAYSCIADGGVRAVTWESSRCMGEPVSVLDYGADMCVATDDSYIKPRCDVMFCRPLDAVNVDWNLDGDTTNDGRNLSAYDPTDDQCFIIAPSAINRANYGEVCGDSPASQAPDASCSSACAAAIIQIAEEAGCCITDYLYSDGGAEAVAASNRWITSQCGIPDGLPPRCEDECPFTLDLEDNPCRLSACANAGDVPSPECLEAVFIYCDGRGSEDPGCEDILGDCPFKYLTLSNPCLSPSCQVPDGEDAPQECLDIVAAYCDDPEHLDDPGCANRGNNCCPYLSAEESNPCLQEVCNGGRNGTDRDETACNEYQITWCQDKRDSEPFCRWFARDTCGCPYSKVNADSPCYNEHCQPSESYDREACANAVARYCDVGDGERSDDPGCNQCPFRQVSLSSPCPRCTNSTADGLSAECHAAIGSYCNGEGRDTDGFCTWIMTGESLGSGCSPTPEPIRTDCDSGNDGGFGECPLDGCDQGLYESCLNCFISDDCGDDRNACFSLLGQICDANPTHPLCRDASAPNFCGCPFRADLNNPCKSDKCTGFLATPSSCAGEVFDYCGAHSDEDHACDNCNLLFSYELGSPCLSDTCSTNDTATRPDDFDACVSDVTSFCESRTQTLTLCSLLLNQQTLPPCDNGGSDFCPFASPDHPDNPCNSEACQVRDTATGDVVDIDFGQSGCLLSAQRWCNEVDAGKTDPACFSNNHCGCNIGSSSASPCSPTGSCLGSTATAASCLDRTVRFCTDFDCCPFDLIPGNPCYTDACTVDGIDDAPENCLALTRSFCNNNPGQAFCSVIFEQTVVPCDGTGDTCRIGRINFPITSTPCTGTACADASSEVSDACEADILSYCIESQDPRCFDLADQFPPAAPQIGDVDQFIGADGDLVVVVSIKTAFFPEVHNYTFQYKTGDNEYTSVDADGSGQVFLEGQLEVGTTYTVRAIANNGQGSSEPGDSFTFGTISGPPDPPQNLRRVAENPDEPCCVTLAWDPPAQEPLGYICLLLDDFVSEFDPSADDSEEPSYFPITKYLPSTQTQVRIELPPPQYDYNLTCVSFNEVGISSYAGSIVETAGEATPPTVRGRLIAYYFDTPEGDIVALDTSDDFDIRSPVPLTAIELWRCNATRANNAIESTCGSFSDSSFDLIHSFPLEDTDDDDFVDTDLDAGQLYVYVARFTNRYGSAHTGVSNAVGIPPSAPEGDSTAFSIDRMTRTSVRVCWDISSFESNSVEPIKAINVVRYGVSGNEGSYTFTFRKSNIFSPSATCTTLIVTDEALIALQLVVISQSLLYSVPGTDQDDYFVIDHIATELTVRSALASGADDGTSAFEVGDKITVGFSEATNEPTITSGVTVTGSDATWTFSWSSSTRLVMTVSAVGSNSPSIGTSELVITTDAGIKPADSPSYLVAATARARLNGNWGVDSDVTIPFEIGQTSFTTLEDQPVSLSGLLTNLDSSVVVTVAFASGDGTFSQTTTLAPNFPIFTPSRNLNGVATFTATITASSLTQTVSGTVVVEAVNDAPVISASILPNPTYLSSITYSTPFAFQGSSELVTDPDSNAEEESETLTCTIRMVGAAMKLNADNIDYDGTAPTIEANTAGTTLRFTVDANGVDAVMSEVEVRASSGVAVVQVLLACIDQGGLQAVGRLVMTVNNDQATDCSQVAAAQMTTAMFSDSGSFIMVSFDADIPASVSQSIGCDVLDATTRAAIGDFAICFWSAAIIGGEVRRGLQIFADLDASIAPGDTITMATDNDLVRCTGGNPATGSATLQRSPNYVPPTLQLIGPTSLDVCQDLTLRVVVLNPGPGTFTTTCTGPVPLPPNQGFYFVLGSRLTADSNLTFSCTLTTGSGDQATDSLVVYKAAQSRPRVRAAVRSITVRPIYGEQFFRFEAIPELSSCGSRTILTYSWTCAFSTVALTGTPYYGFTTSNVPSGTTQCGVQVCVSGTTKCATATFSVTRIASALRANIFGPTTVPEDFGTITLDTVYSDPDNRGLAATDFTWTWTCTNAETGVACTNTATGAALALSSFRNRVTLNAANLETLANLEFTLVLSRGTRSVTTTWTLFIEEAPPEPLPTFQVKVARFSAFVRAEAVVFVPNGGSFADVQNYGFAWSIVELPELTSTSRFSWFLPLGELRDALQTSSSSGDTSSVVDQVVRPSMPATQLTFRVTVTNSEGGSRSGDAIVSTDGPPRGCSVDIINLEEAAAGNATTGGTAFETEFSIEATGCTVDGSNNDIRRYAFYHTRDGERPLLIGTSSSNAITRKLPVGHEADSKLTIIVVVRDQRGAEAGFTSQITVNPPADTLSAAQTAVENLASEASLTRSVDDVVEQASTAMSVLALLDDSCDSGCDEAAVAQTKAELASSVISTLTTFADNFDPNEVDGYCLDSASTGDSAAQSALDFFINSFAAGDFGSMDLSAGGSFARLLQIWLDLAAAVAKRTKAMHEHKRLNKMTIRVTAEQESANNNLESTLNLLDQSFIDTLGDDTDSPVGTSGSTTTTSLVGRYSRIGQQRGVDTTATFVVDSKTTTIAFTSVDQTASASWTDIDVRTFVMSPNSLIDETTPTDEAADVAAIYRLKAAPIDGQGSLPALVLNMDTPVRFTFETGTACTTTGRVCECQIWDQTTNQWNNDTRLTAETSGTSLVCSLDLSASDTEAHDFIVAPFSKADSSGGGDDDADESSSTDNTPVIAGAAGAVVLLLAVGIYCCCCKSDKSGKKSRTKEMELHNRSQHSNLQPGRHTGHGEPGARTGEA